MPITTDPATPLGLVRLLVRDTDVTAPLFQDADLTALLNLEGQSVRRAAATALETVATDNVLLMQVLQTADVKTDGAKVSTACLERAKQLRAEALEDDAATGAGIDWAEQVLDPATARQRVWEQWERGAG